MPVIFLVAAVDGAPVLVRGMPDLGSEETTALPAFDFAGENAHAAVASAFLLAPCNLLLYHLEGGRGDNGRTALLHKVAGDLPVVLHSFLVRKSGVIVF